MPFLFPCVILPFAAECRIRIRGISTVGRTNHLYLRPTGNQFRKPTIGADGKYGRNCYQIRGISTDGRTSLPYCRPRQTLVNQGNPFKMKGNVTRPADVKRGKLPRKTSGNPYGALAQLVARDIRIVEVRGSTPLCSTRREALKSLDFRAFLFSPGCGVNGALAHLSGSAFSIVAGLIAAILYK